MDHKDTCYFMICKTCKGHRGVGWPLYFSKNFSEICLYMYTYMYVHNTLVIHFKNERGCRDFKTKCIQTTLGWYHSNKIKHHFHITIAAKLILLTQIN